MAPERKGFVNVDELVARLPDAIERAARFYGVALPELHRTGQETRTRCFLSCGRTRETGDRVLAIREDHPAKQWRCHEYSCGKGGNFAGLCDLMKGGASEDGKPRGERFRSIALDIEAMAGGQVQGPEAPRNSPANIVATPDVPAVNLPLAESANERARSLVDLDRKFAVEVAGMPPAASAYVRRRPFLTPEGCRSFRVGYLPRDAGGDAAGGTMRGKIVYAYHAIDGKLLTWFGRDPDFEEKYRRWEAGGKTDREPAKFHFVKGFHRGLELYGQERLRMPERAEKLRQLGLILVEGPNDVIRLDSLGVPAVALCSNRITREQAERVAALAYELAGGIATVFLDCDTEGEAGMKQALGFLSQLVPVRLAWTGRMHGGKFGGRQPESLTLAEWREIEGFLRRGENQPLTGGVGQVKGDGPRVPADPGPWDFL